METFDYLERRLEEQRQWHSRKGAWNKRWFYRLEITTLAAGAAIPVVNLLSIHHPARSAVFSGMLGALVVVSSAVSKLFKFHENWLQYRTAAEALGREKELYLSGSGAYAEADTAKRNQLLVERVENMLSATTTQFVATHRAVSEPESKAQ